jgi:hypothetical protein
MNSARIISLLTLLLFTPLQMATAETSQGSKTPIWAAPALSRSPSSSDSSSPSKGGLAGVPIKGPTAPLLNSPKNPDFVASDGLRAQASQAGSRLVCNAKGGKILKAGEPGYEQCVRDAQSGASPQSPAGSWGAPGTQLWLRN